MRALERRLSNQSGHWDSARHPLGNLKLEDEYFRDGRIAAAAIALKMRGH